MPNKLLRAKHIDRDKTKCHENGAGQEKALGSELSHEPPRKTHIQTKEGVEGVALARTPSVGSSALLMSACVIVSRITGFIRTWTMAFALGATLLSSSYQIANNLPYMLYELVAGGLLVTAFLPVYLSVKRKLGAKASNDFASSLLSIVLLFLGLISILCMLFPSVVIYTQSFLSDQGEMGQAVFFFQFFAIQIIFYGASAIMSGLLNANRDYLWSNLAPAFNNLIVISTFFAYYFLAPFNAELALYVIAIGNPFGVVVQMLIQLPSVRRNGIRLRFHINWKDPALKETLSIGVPAFIIMVYSFVVTSTQTAASYSFAENGPSIIFYARMWFTLPYSFLVVPLSTALFTELASMYADKDIEGVKRAIVSGSNQIIFLMIPFMFYLIVFASPLISLYHAGAFTSENIQEVAIYLSVFALALPFYGINTYFQRVFSTMRKLNVFALVGSACALFQIALTLIAASLASQGILPIPISSIALAEMLFFVICDGLLFMYLRKYFGRMGFRSTLKAAVSGLAVGLIGAVVGAGLLYILERCIAPIDGNILTALAYIVIAGLASIFTSFGLALKFKVKETAFIVHLISTIKRRLGRA